MEILKVNNKTAIFLDHNKLISELYVKYKFKPSIFAYNRKETTSKKRKLPPEIEEVSQDTNDFLKLLKVSTNEVKCKDIKRIWEENIEFPCFHGGNNQDVFIKFPFINENYLIPPNCRFFNKSIFDINEEIGTFDFIVMDPPWRNKYIRRIKKTNKNMGYKMIDDESLSKIPLEKYVHNRSFVAVWCTNSQQHQQSLLEKFLPKWNLRLLAKWFWIKITSRNELVSDFNEHNKKQPYETIFIACHKDFDADVGSIKEIAMLISSPSIIHSHKPPLKSIFENILPKNSKSLEIFARYLQPDFTSIGLEVLKLMDLRLYDVFDDSV